MIRILLTPFLAFLLCGLADSPALTSRATVLSGDSPHLVVEGLRPGETVTLHGMRIGQAWAQDPQAGWSRQPFILHAWARVSSDAQGRIDLDTAVPLDGSYRQADGLGLIWSGYRRGAPELATVAAEEIYNLNEPDPNSVVFRLVRRGTVVAEARTRIARQRQGMVLTDISEPGLVGVFAAPADAIGLPVVIQLHGSEGSDPANARERALRFASRGYATLALTYTTRFAQPDDDPHTPDEMVEIPLEMIAAARAWLAERPEVDVERIAVHGWSKGAEFALVAAQRFAWIDAVVACVPTDLVWQGGGAEPGLPRHSTWSFEGQPLPFVPLYPYIPEENLYRTNTDRYERSLLELGDAEGQARIAIEHSAARFLLIGADRDAVWASGEMARRLQARLAQAGRAGDVELVTYPMAGHDICGDGAGPARLYYSDPPGPQAADPTANGEASRNAAERTLDFLERTVGPPYAF